MTAIVGGPTAEMTFEHEGGRISVSRIDNRNGKECWIHDLEVPKGCPPMLAVQLMARARRQAAEWAFEDVIANISNPRLATILRDHGWVISQVVVTGKTGYRKVKH